MNPVTFTHILAPTDFSAPSERAVAAAAHLARAFGARLTILHVLESDFESAALAYGFRPMLAEYIEKTEQAAVEQLDAAAAAMKDLDVSILVTRGTASMEVVRTAREEGCDVIVIGTHGQSALRHMLFGSTAERVLRKAPCPVLAVPGGDEEHEADAGGEPSPTGEAGPDDGPGGGIPPR
jgi:nucleotide-binding universal stress UspA family protein